MINYTRIVWTRRRADEPFSVNRLVYGRLFSWTYCHDEDTRYYWRLQESWDPGKQQMQYWPEEPVI